MRTTYVREFPSKATIIDDVMLELQTQQHTKQELLKAGYTRATY